MYVELVSFTPQPEKLCALAARICYTDKEWQTLKQSITEKEIHNLLERVISSGHLSVIEHASFSFYIESISRACSHQLVRHRLASFSQRSHRYSKAEGFVTPPSLKSEKIYLETLDKAQKTYNLLLKKGIKKEDARFILPQAVSTRIFLTMNARELLHFFRLRCCYRAQWEIREVATEMLKQAKKVAPFIFKVAGPPCLTGPCPEKEPCGTNIIEIRNFFKNL